MAYFGAGAPTSGTNEVQTFTISGSPTGGTFTPAMSENSLSGDATVAFDISAANLATALNALAPIIAQGGVTVGLSGAVYTVTSLAGRNIPAFSVTHAFAGGTSPNIVVATTVPGVAGTFAGKAPKGAQYTDTTNGKLYINTGTQNTPTWTVVGAQS